MWRPQSHKSKQKSHLRHGANLGGARSPPTSTKVMLDEDKDTVIKAGDDERSLVIIIPKSLTRRQIVVAIERIFSKEMAF